jgi:large subunit ribosomal protein L31
MKTDIQPTNYSVEARCACGNSFETSSTKQELKVTICSKCHPFFTGETRFVDNAGRIEKFERKYKKAGK